MMMPKKKIAKIIILEVIPLILPKFLILRFTYAPRGTLLCHEEDPLKSGAVGEGSHYTC